jgi:UDP:flavonoid glycosyltransferase YjiC (YdhE family)
MTAAKLVDLVVPPMSGHLHPILGIARRLAQEDGLEVRVISTSKALPEIEVAGLAGVALLEGLDATISEIVNPSHAVRGNPLRLYRQFGSNLSMLGRFRIELADLWSHRRPDLVIADFTVPVAGSMAMELGIPWWTTTPSPCAIETPDGPPAYLGGWQPRSGVIGAVRDHAGRGMVRSFKRVVHALNRGTLTDLGYPQVYRCDGSEAIYSAQRTFALVWPELEFVRRWPRAVELVGPVLYTPEVHAPEPPFVEGRRHVLVTCGTHLSWRRAEFAEATARAARAMPEVEFHISDGDAAGVGHESAGNLHQLAYVSYPLHLHRYDLVVHHGGAGVLAHTLAAGLPAIVVPADYDQFDFAARLHAAGVALPLRKLSDLPALIANALGDRRLAAAARHFCDPVGALSAQDRIAGEVSTFLAGSP